MALDAAAFGDTVLVAPGTYTTAEVRSVDLGGGVPVPTVSLAFLQDGVVLKSEAGPQSTVLDLQGQTASWAAVVVAAFLPSHGTVVDGFTISGSPLGWNGMIVSECGKVTVRDCVFQDLDATSVAYSGGGITCGAAHLAVERTIFRNCHAAEGGGVWFYEGDSASQGDLTVDGCTFENCSQRALEVGGDFVAPRRVALVKDTVFRGNSSNIGSGALGAFDYTMTIEGCSFYDNVATGAGGGAIALWVCNFTIRDCLFVRNSVGAGNGVGGAVYGGAIAGGSTVEQCTFYGNTQQWPGGGAAIYLDALYPTVTTHILQSNVIAANAGAKAVEAYRGMVDNSCNVFWENAAGDVQGFALDATDRVVDPQFCDVSFDDYQLSESSPCLPANSLGCGLVGSLGQGCGTTSIAPTTWARIKAMYGR